MNNPLSAILDNTDEELPSHLLEARVPSESTASTATTSSNNAQQKSTRCVECIDVPALVKCRECEDQYCAICFRALHLKGNRSKHHADSLADGSVLQLVNEQSNINKSNENNNIEEDDMSDLNALADQVEAEVSKYDENFFVGRAKFVPLRLGATERIYLRLLQASVFVSDYVDKIDVPAKAKGNKRVFAQLREICSILSGIIFKKNYEHGQTIISDKNFEAYSTFLQAVFELGRRYKILNPERLRGEYGKLMYVLQDSQVPEVEDMLHFSLKMDIHTVYELLENAGPEALKLLRDHRVEVATRAITYDPKRKTRAAYDREVRLKYETKKRLIREYATMSTGLQRDDVELCLNSIGDNRSFLLDNLEPVKQMLALLREHFKPDAAPANGDDNERIHSLAIAEGSGGARLTHSHERQYRYVEQSLMLWAEILDNFFELWWLADQDLLSSTQRYTLTDTGQGAQRVQPAPLVERRMRQILATVQKRCTTWVGSSVVHLGDRNVPNALHFIDKYTQVARILKPIVLTVQWVTHNYETKTRVEKYVDHAYGGLDNAIKLILCDFFRFAFDGSGADNFYDAGSCIDGRLTSAWHWCQSIESKEFYPLFLLAGFTGFDGEFGQQ